MTTTVTTAPYPGLRPYQETEQANFFGRNNDCEILVDKLLANRLTLLFAASGVGKSSLLNAAVLPRLKDPFGENLSVVCYSDWVSHPVTGLSRAIQETLAETPDYTGKESLPELLAFCTLFTRHPLILVLDQFEEFFRYQRGTEGFDQFILQLTDLILNPNLAVNVVISMREDFALELNAFKPRLPTLLFENYYRLEAMTPDTARDAIVSPLKPPVGFSYEPALLDQLLEDLSSRKREGEGLPHEATVIKKAVEPPYLQIVCARLWELNKDNDDKLIRLASYEKAGRDTGILTRFLHEALSGLSSGEKQIASRAFDYLAAQRGVKMAYPLDVLANVSRVKATKLEPVLDKLAGDNVRILRTQERSGITWYELYHDMFSASVERWNNDWKEQRLRRQRWVMGSGLTVLAATTALLVDSFMWVQNNYFPADYLFQEQKFRLMNWGLLPEPLPEMVEIPLPEGEVRIGELDESVAKNYNGQLKNSGSYSRQNFGNPILSISFKQPFAMGKFEITYEEYDYYVWQQHQSGTSTDSIIYPTGATRNNGRGELALTQVSWNEAVEYTQWLSEKTGEEYRLPTEVEWEYAARAGSETAYWWGEEAEGLNKANCADCGSEWDNKFIAPVGQHAPNDFGLYDTAGNVWEWTCSEWASELSEGLPNNCSTTDADTNLRVIRGGSWYNDAVWLRSSARSRNNTDDRIVSAGFRILRLSRTP